MRRPKKLTQPSSQQIQPAAELAELIFRELESYNAKRNPNRLLECDGVDREELLRRVNMLRAYRPKMEPRKYPKRKARDTARRIRGTADLVESLNDDRDNGIALLGDNWHLTAALNASRIYRITVKKNGNQSRWPQSVNSSGT